jgi:hypothetical protein
MIADQTPTAADPPAAEAWQEIEAALDELASLSRSDVSPDEFHGKLLQRLAGLLGATGGAIWSLGPEGQGVACQLHLDEALAGDEQELARHARLAEAVAASGTPRLIPPAYRDAQFANSSPWLAALCPARRPAQQPLVVELLLQPDGRSSVEEGYLRLIRTACDLAEEYHRGRAIGDLQVRERDLSARLAYLERVHRHLELTQCAAAIANEGRRALGCDRVTLLASRGARPRVVAISGVESFDRRSGVVEAIEQLAGRVAATGEPLWHPGDELAPQLTGPVESLVEASHARGFGVIPLLAGEEDERELVGVLVVEQFQAEVEAFLRERATIIAEAASGALANSLRYDRIPLRGPLVRSARFLGLGRGDRQSPALVAAGALALAAMALVLIPAELKIEARGQAMPVRRQQIFAPSDAVVIELVKADGASVAAGDVLARLHSPSLDIAQSELVGKQRTVQEDLLAAETESLRNELEDAGSPARGQVTARIEQLKEELRGIEAQLTIVRQQQADLDLQSPLAGAVITWDAARQLSGRPVKRGDALLTVADLSGPWELLLDVPDRRAGHVLAAAANDAELPVTFQLGTDPGKPRTGHVAAISPATELSAESGPAVRVTASLDEAAASQLRPGATVVAQIHCGRRSLGYVWLHELLETVRSRLFF